MNSVLPGLTLTESVTNLLNELHGDSDKSIEELANEMVRSEYPASLIQRVATVEEVANMVVYLASPQASATTGAALRVDGGVIDTV